MADTKISALSSGSPAAVGDEFIIARSGSDYKLTLRQILAARTLDYVEQTSSLTVTATTDATAQAFVTGNAVSYDGSTVVIIEAYIPFGAATAAMVCNLYDGSTDLGRLGQINTVVNAPMYLARRLTPSNASHTYSIRIWKTSGTASANCGAGGTATNLPGFIRISLV